MYGVRGGVFVCVCRVRDGEGVYRVRQGVRWCMELQVEKGVCSDR